MLENIPPPPKLTHSRNWWPTNNIQLWIITGNRQSGKTTWCINAANIMRSQNISVAGVLCHAQVKNNIKVNIYLEDLITRDKKLLGSVDPIPKYDLLVGRWYFSQSVLSWGNKCLKKSAGYDVVIFDECGPLELVERKGFQSGLNLFDECPFRLGIIVIRPEMLSFARDRWPAAKLFKVVEGQ